MTALCVERHRDAETTPMRAASACRLVARLWPFAARPVRDAGRRGRRHDDLPVRPGAVDRHDPAVRRPRSSRRARHLRAAGRLGRALRRGAPAGAPPDRGPHDRESGDRARGERSRWTWSACAWRRATAIESLHPHAGPIAFVAALGAGRPRGARVAGRSPRYGCGRCSPARAAGALAIAVAVALLLPPREPVENPEYYANGSEIPVALRVAQQATDSAQAISQDLDDQLLGLARLISVPARAPAHGPLPRLTLASDLHNNLLALPALERAAPGAALLRRRPHHQRRAARGRPHAGGRAGRRPFVFVSGNHDSDTL